MNSVFDNFIEKAKNIVDATTQKTGEVVEISKLKMDCVKLHNELRNLYEKLGCAVYHLVKNDYKNDDLVESLTEEIDEQLKQLKLANDKIASFNNVIICPACSTKNSDDCFYCTKCGCRLKDEFSDFNDQE
ncbi:MAG: hypothetical protein RR036_00175 [Oscillospiraceae bacterium]